MFSVIYSHLLIKQILGFQWWQCCICLFSSGWWLWTISSKDSNYKVFYTWSLILYCFSQRWMRMTPIEVWDLDSLLRCRLLPWHLFCSLVKVLMFLSEGDLILDFENTYSKQRDLIIFRCQCFILFLRRRDFRKVEVKIQNGVQMMVILLVDFSIKVLFKSKRLIMFDTQQ